MIRRLPARESRWRRWSPEDASIGAVPFHEREVPCGAEPVNVADVAQESGCSGWADAVEFAHRTARRGHELAQLLVSGSDLGVDDGQVLDEFPGELVAGLGDDVHRLRCGP